jgi:hypothetical protein
MKGESLMTERAMDSITYDAIAAHIKNGGALLIKSYTRPTIIKQIERIKPGREKETGIDVSTDKYGRRFEYVFPGGFALIRT